MGKFGASINIGIRLIFIGRDNMDILADIFYISAKMGNFSKMGHSTMQIFYENGLVDNLLRLAVCSFVRRLFERTLTAGLKLISALLSIES